jgi:cysteine desulfurase
MEKSMKAYLDNSATTRPDDRVIEKMAECMREGFYNPSSVYGPAVGAMRRGARLPGGNPETVRGRAASWSLPPAERRPTTWRSLARRKKSASCGRRRLGVEHPSVLASYEALAARGVDVRVIGVDERGAA